MIKSPSAFTAAPFTASRRRTEPPAAAVRSALLSRDTGIALLLSAMVLAALLLTCPFANVPMNDDFSYARTAQALANTGHIVYNGWGSPLLWPQAAYGAVIIRLFGFSYSILAMTGVAMAALSTGLFYRLARLCGCRTDYAVAATLALTLNPVFLSVAPSFLNDIPSLALFLASLIVLVKSIRTGEDGSVRLETVPFAFSAFLGLVAGSNRQLIWVTYLFAAAVLFVLIPAQRKRIGIVIGVVLDLALTMNYWYSSQPYTVTPEAMEGIRHVLVFPGTIAISMLRYLDEGGVFLLPLALLALPRLRARGVSNRTIGIACVVWFALIVLPYHTPYKMPSYGIFPYAQYFTSQGALIGGPPGYSRRPVMLPAPVSIGITAAGAIGLALFTLLAVSELRECWAIVRAARRNPDGDITPRCPLDRERVVQAVVFGACFVQFPVSIFWFFSNYIFDRYLLLFLPGFLIFLACQAGKQTVSPRLRTVAAATLAFTGAIGFAFAQEYAAYGHARANLYHKLRAAGVPAIAINSGFELDADTQIVQNGYVNSPQVVIPQGAFNPNLKAPHVSFLPEEFTVLRPQFRISSDSVILPTEDAYPTPVAVETYHSLLPPFKREMYVYRIRE